MFHLLHVHILRTHHYGNTRLEAFVHCAAYKDVFWRRDHEEGVVSSFAHQIQSEYYGGNIWVSIEEITLEHFSYIDQEKSSSSLHSRTHHEVFHLFLSGRIKHNAATTDTHSKRTIELLKQMVFSCWY